MSIAAVVVTHNSSDCIKECLNGLVASPLVTEIVVVDNGSTDETVATTRAHDPRIRIMPLENNRGFAAAANAGAAIVEAPTLAFVNPDATILPAAVEVLLRTLQSNATVWAVGPALLNDLGLREHSARGFPSEWSTLLNRRFLEMFPRSRNRELRRFLMLDSERTKIFECDWLSGALFFIRRTDFIASGGFDERFFMYYEDADLFRRRASGRPVLFVGTAVASHAIGMSSRRIPIRSGLWRVRSAWRYYRKHLRRGVRTDAIYLIATACGVLMEIASFVRKRT